MWRACQCLDAWKDAGLQLADGQGGQFLLFVGHRDQRHDQESMDALAERMKALLGPFVLRRLKSEVASQLVMKEQRVRVQCLMPLIARALSVRSCMRLCSAQCMLTGSLACRHCRASSCYLAEAFWL